MHEISEPYHPRLSPEANITDFLERQATERPDHGLLSLIHISEPTRPY